LSLSSYFKTFLTITKLYLATEKDKQMKRKEKKTEKEKMGWKFLLAMKTITFIMEHIMLQAIFHFFKWWICM